jgi:hypothetical protein
VVDASQAQGFELIHKQVEPVRDQVEESFYALVDFVEFAKTAIAVINEVGGAISAFNVCRTTPTPIPTTSQCQAHL